MQDENLICGVTSKYLKAISRHLWIVSFRWIVHVTSRAAGGTSTDAKEMIERMLSAECANFEICGDTVFGRHDGPMRSRLALSSANKSDPLFHAHEFMFLGKFSAETVSMEEMSELAVLNGATIVHRAKDFSENTAHKRVVLVDSSAKRMSAKTAQLLATARISPLCKTWLLDSLACYTLRDMTDANYCVHDQA